MALVSRKKLDRIMDKATKSNVAKSTRRFFFNHLSQSMKERGHFHVDQMYGSGSGVVIKFDETYFILTAKHVLDNNLQGLLQNESPFWLSIKNKPEWNSLYDFFFPKFQWNIGELIPEIDGSVDVKDICLIELFHPQEFHMPDHYIEIENISSVLARADFFDGQFLLTTGYPFISNTFSFEPVDDVRTHSTTIERHTIPGIFKSSDKLGHISFEATNGEVNHESMNGMSGGAIYNVMPKANQVKLAGIPVSAGDKVCRFIPSYLFIDAILDHKGSSKITLDPAVDTRLSLEEVVKISLAYLEEYDPAFRNTLTNGSNKATKNAPSAQDAAKPRLL
jgi:hypothetical protein